MYYLVGLLYFAWTKASWCGTKRAQAQETSLTNDNFLARVDANELIHSRLIYYTLLLLLM